jgi:internalin A
LTERAVVTVDAHQLGGRPERLQAALVSVPVKSCTMATIDGCHAIIDRLLAYLTEPGGFSDQMARLAYEHDAPESNTTVLSYVTRRYNSGGFRQLYPEPAPLVGLEQQAALDRLAGELERLEQDRRRGEHLLAVYRLREPHKETLRRALSGPIRRNVNNALDSVNLCFRAPLRCLASEDAYWRGREGYDESLLDKPITFFDYCIDRQASGERTRTVDALLQLAGTSDCGAAEERLEMLPSLELSGRGLTDISPLRGLFSLTSVDLAGNAIVEVDVLGSLVQLQRIRLRDNSVTTAAPLAGLPALRELDLSYNALFEAAPIASAPALRWLKLHGNPLIDAEALDRSRYELVFLEEDDACAHERDRLVASGRLPRAEAEEYAELSMGPAYERYGDPASAFDWYACKVTAPTYP